LVVVAVGASYVTEYVVMPLLCRGLAVDVAAALRHFWPLPWQVGVGLGLGAGDVVLGAVVAGAVVLTVVGRGAVAVVVVRVADEVAWWVGVVAAVRDGLAASAGVILWWLVGAGLEVTSMCRLPASWAPYVDGTELSGSAWKPTTASNPVAAVASATMTTLDSSGPRVRARVTVGLLPSGAVRTSCPYIGRLPHRLYPTSYFG
jgi:hypothetical protein